MLIYLDPSINFSSPNNFSNPPSPRNTAIEGRLRGFWGISGLTQFLQQDIFILNMPQKPLNLPLQTLAKAES